MDYIIFGILYGGSYLIPRISWLFVYVLFSVEVLESKATAAAATAKFRWLRL